MKAEVIGMVVLGTIVIAGGGYAYYRHESSKKAIACLDCSNLVKSGKISEANRRYNPPCTQCYHNAVNSQTAAISLLNEKAMNATSQSQKLAYLKEIEDYPNQVALMRNRVEGTSGRVVATVPLDVSGYFL